MPKQRNIELVSELHADIQNASAMLMTDYRGLTVSEITELRRSLRASGTDYKVAKNTLLELAAKDQIDADLSELLSGPSAVAFVHEDPVATAKILVEFARKHKALEIKGGYVEGKVYGVDQIQALSKVPPRDVLISQMLGAFQSPITGFVGTLQGILAEFVFTVQAVADKKAAA